MQYPLIPAHPGDLTPLIMDNGVAQLTRNIQAINPSPLVVLPVLESFLLVVVPVPIIQVVMNLRHNHIILNEYPFYIQ